MQSPAGTSSQRRGSAHTPSRPPPAARRSSLTRVPGSVPLRLLLPAAGGDLLPGPSADGVPLCPPAPHARVHRFRGSRVPGHVLQSALARGVHTGPQTPPKPSPPGSAEVPKPHPGRGPQALHPVLPRRGEAIIITYKDENWMLSMKTYILLITKLKTKNYRCVYSRLLSML